jgi:hypothetical protein
MRPCPHCKGRFLILQGPDEDRMRRDGCLACRTKHDAQITARWDGPRVECWDCGTGLEPTTVVPVAALAVAFWSIPHHPAFPAAEDHRIPACTGSGRLLGPVRS